MNLLHHSTYWITSDLLSKGTWVVNAKANIAPTLHIFLYVHHDVTHMYVKGSGLTWYLDADFIILEGTKCYRSNRSKFICPTISSLFLYSKDIVPCWITFLLPLKLSVLVWNVRSRCPSNIHRPSCCNIIYFNCDLKKFNSIKQLALRNSVIQNQCCSFWI